MTNASARHIFEDHVGEVRLRIEAPTLAELFEQAARGLAELMLGTAPPSPATGEGETIAIRAGDREALLVDFLNELIFLSETQARIFTDVRVRRVSDTGLEAEVRGVVPEVARTVVKAATLHGLKVEDSPMGFAATVVLDV